MAGPEPKDVYNPTQTIEPTVGQPNDYLQVRANPTSFGAQTGEAIQGMGKALEGQATPLIDLAIKYQGMINESAAVNGETNANKAYGAIMGEYQSKKGLDAVSAFDEATQKIQTVRQQIRSSMPNAMAARAFDLLVARSEGYVLRDAATYRATQLKAASVKSAEDSLSMSISMASSPTVAIDNNRFAEQLANIKFRAAQLLSEQGYGIDSGTGMKQDPTTGDLTFDESTEQGKQASAVASNYIKQAIGKAWENRLEVLGFDPTVGNVNKAVAVLEANKENIPPEAYARMAAKLSGPYHNAQTRTIADNTAHEAEEEWNKSNTLLTTNAPLSPNTATVLDVIRAQEGGPTSNVFQIQPGTWQQHANKTEDITNPIDNERVASRIIDGYMSDYNGDAAKVAVAYFSGPGNVAANGSPNPWIEDKIDKNGKSVSSYVNDILKKTQGQQFGAPQFTNKADFLRTHYAEYAQKAYDRAVDQFPDHPELAYQAVTRTEQYMNNIIRQQELSDRVALKNVYDYVMRGTEKGQPLTSISQIETGPPEIQKAWRDMQMNYPLQANNLIQRLTLQNARGKAGSYGSNFWQAYQDITSGKVSTPYQLGSDIDGIKITNTGFSELKELLDDQSTPAGKVWSESAVKFFQQAHDQIVAAPMFGGTDQQGENYFNRFMQQVLPEIKQARTEGKSAGEVFNAASQDFIGNGIQQFIRSDAQKWTSLHQSLTASMNLSLGKTTFDPKDLDKAKDATTGTQLLYSAVKNKQISPTEADNLAIKHGWYNPKAPPVPTEGIPQ